MANRQKIAPMGLAGAERTANDFDGSGKTFCGGKRRFGNGGAFG